MNKDEHCGPYYFSPNTKVTCDDLFLIVYALPNALGINLLRVGPTSSFIFFMYNLSVEIPRLFFALETADFSNFEISRAGERGTTLRKSLANLTGFPERAAVTALIFRGDIPI